MSLKSMTGFGKAICELPDKKISIEIRSLNSKQLDMNLRLSSLFRDKEAEVRSEASKNIERGKADVGIFVEYTGVVNTVSINKPLALTYYNELKSLAEELQESRQDYLSLITRMPDVISKSEKQEPDENEWKVVKETLMKAFSEFNNFRSAEGKTLQNEFEQRIKVVDNLLEEVKKLDTIRLQNQREKLRKAIEENVPAEKVDKNRFEQELIYYFEKLDITEEKVRLKTHLDYFVKTMEEESSCGRKLGFISQEIGREMNTIGSKANDAFIQKIVVQMKDELEKMKEQLLNVL